MGRQMTAGGVEKSQQCHMYILQYSKFAPEKYQVRTWGRQTCFLPRAPSNLVTPLHARDYVSAPYFIWSLYVKAVAYAENFHGDFIQWHVVVICIWCALFVTSCSFQTNVLAKFVDVICIFFYTHSPYFINYESSKKRGCRRK